MGSATSRVSQWFYRKRSVRVLIVGLDTAGKTTMLYQLKLGEVVTTIPTIGFNVESIQAGDVEIVAWDVGMRSKSRPLLRHYYPNTDAIIFVVDSLDMERIDEVKEFLDEICAEDELRDSPILVLANKQDAIHACSPEILAEKLGLRRIKNRPWHIVPCSAVQGKGLTDGLDWLVGTITGKMVQTDVSQSLKTSANDVTTTASYLKQKFDLSKGMEWFLWWTGCKGRSKALPSHF